MAETLWVGSHCHELCTSQLMRFREQPANQCSHAGVKLLTPPKAWSVALVVQEQHCIILMLLALAIGPMGQKTIKP